MNATEEGLVTKSRIEKHKSFVPQFVDQCGLISASSSIILPTSLTASTASVYVRRPASKPSRICLTAARNHSIAIVLPPKERNAVRAHSAPGTACSLPQIEVKSGSVRFMAYPGDVNAGILSGFPGSAESHGIDEESTGDCLRAESLPAVRSDDRCYFVTLHDKPSCKGVSR